MSNFLTGVFSFLQSVHQLPFHYRHSLAIGQSFAEYSWLILVSQKLELNFGLVLPMSLVSREK